LHLAPACSSAGPSPPWPSPSAPTSGWIS
jgi:hypothetical protein